MKFDDYMYMLLEDWPIGLLFFSTVPHDIPLMLYHTSSLSWNVHVWTRDVILYLNFEYDFA